MRALLIVVSVIAILSSACIYLPSAPGGDSGQTPVITTFEASPNSISPGERSQLSWSVTGARSVTIDNGVGSVALRGTRAVVPAATTTYVLTASNPQGTSTATVQVIVGGGGGSPPSSLAPTISSFSAVPSFISAGGSSVLSWNISNASVASISPGVGSVNPVSGTQSVFPMGTTNYTLTASNSAGSVSQVVMISMGGSPPPGGLPVINTFEAVPNVIPLGASTTLTWNVSGAASVTIISGGGSLLVVGSAGSIATTPAATNTYTLQATNSGGMVFKTITVLVGGGGGGVDVTPPTVPNLLTPAEGATLPQPSSPWNFDWADSSDPESGIQKYQLYVINLTAANPVIDTYTVVSHYSVTLGGTIGPANLLNWTWKVRAQNTAGLWSDWSPVRTFKVEGTSHTVNLSPVAVETGAVYKDGTVASGVKFAGDTSGNVGIRCYFSYDIASLAGKNVDSAKLTFSTNNIVRNPFGNLGVLWIARVNYGAGPLQAADYGITGSPFTSVGAPPVEVNVTALVKNAALAADPRFQVRLHYASETNNDNLADYINFSNAVLTVTYTD